VRAVIYKRVSDDEQVKEGYSLDSQRAICMRWIADKNYSLVDEYTDEGKSAKNMKRPDLQRLMRDIESRKFDVLVFWRLNRLTRNLKDKIHLFELCDKYNVSIKSMSEEIDTTTASGRMVTNLLVSVAQGEREQTAENVHATMLELAMKGVRNGAVAPYGYDSVDGKLVINPMEAEVVKRIYALYQRNIGIRGIAKMFNNDSIPKGDRVGTWSDNSVYYILTNPTYCGKLRWNYRKQAGKRTGNEIIADGDHEPIISEEEFQRVQKMRELRAKIGKRATSIYCFTGVLRCERCGYAMIGDSKPTKHGRSRYYKCIGRHNYGTCKMPNIAERSVHEAFLGVFDPDPANLEQYYVSEVAVASDEAQLRDQLESELESILKRKKKWQIAYANDAITLEELKEHTDEDKKREEYIKKELEGMTEQKRSHMDPSEVIQQLKHLRKLWYQIDDEIAKKNFINEVFSHITINTEVTEAKGGPGRRVPCYVADWDFEP
jgi:site-specific DNA recombinase